MQKGEGDMGQAWEPRAKGVQSIGQSLSAQKV